MTQEEKISLLEKIRLDYAFLGTPSFDVLTNAIDALKGPWVKTADRLPTEADADNTMCWVLATTISSDLPMPEAIAYIRANPDNYPYWMPIPPLPEVEE